VELRKLINEIESIKEERQSLEEELKGQQDDMGEFRDFVVVVVVLFHLHLSFSSFNRFPFIANYCTAIRCS